MLTKDDLTNLNGLAHRSLGTITQNNAGQTGTFSGLGLVYGETYETPWFRERFERGCVAEDHDAAAVILSQHDSHAPIGRVTDVEETDAGRTITARLGTTTTAQETRALMTDGILTGLSVGFEPVQWREEHSDDDEKPLIVHEKIAVREYSVVTFPAYSTAQISEARHQHITARKDTPTMDHVTRSELDAVSTAFTDKITDLERRAAAGEFAPSTGTSAFETRAAQFANPGEWIQAAMDARSDLHDEAITLHRDLTTSNVPSHMATTPGWIGDLTRKVTERRRWTNLFDSKPLPAKGMSVDYIKTTNSATVAEQKKELDKLATGTAFTVQTASAKVRTFGGAETISRQVIDRSEPWVISDLWEALALEYARETETATRKFILDQITARSEGGSDADPATLTVANGGNAFDWIDAIVDAGGIFEDRGYDLQCLAVSPDLFKKLASEAATDGRPLMTVYGEGVNVVGEANLPAGSGNMMRLPVLILRDTPGVADPVKNKALFFDPIAIRTMESSGAPFQLQEDNVLNLSRDVAAYGYMAHLAPYPDALVPVKVAA